MAGNFKIGASIVLDGEKEFKQAVTSVNKDIAVLSSEMAKTTAAFANNADSVEALTAKQDVLSRQLLSQKEKVETLAAALKKSANEFGESDTKTKNWQISLNQAEAAMSKTQAEIDKTTAKLKSLENAEDDATGKASVLGDVFKGAFFANIASDAVGALASELKQFASDALSTADELAKLTDQTGRSIEELQTMRYVGDDLGVSLETQTGALSKLINNMESAQSGTGSAANAFKSLAVSVVDANGNLRDASTVYGEVLDALGGVENATQATALAQDVFGKSAMELNPLIKAGSQGMSELAQQAKNAGAIMSNEAVAALDSMGDAFDHFKQAASAFVGETLAGLMSTGKSVASINEDIAKSSNVNDLIKQYSNLKLKLNDNTLSETKLKDAAKELTVVKQSLVAVSGGLITATADETGEFDKQVAKLKELSEAQLKIYTQELIGKAQGYNDELKSQADLQDKLNAAADKQAEAMSQINEQRLNAAPAAENSALLDFVQQTALTKNYALASEEAKNSLDGLRAETEKLAKALDDSKGKTNEAETAIALLSKAGYSLNEIMTLTGISADALNKVLADPALNDSKALTDNATASVDQLKTSYDSLLESTKSALDGMIDQWAKVDVFAVTSAKDTQDALQSQIEWYMYYDQMLNELKDRKIEGVDMTPLIKSLSDGTAESYKILSGLTTATDDQVRHIADSMYLRSDYETKFAKTITDTNNQIGALFGGMKTVAEKQLNASDAAIQAGKDTMQGYIDGVKSMQSDVVKAFSDVANAALKDGHDKTMDRHSPSRVMGNAAKDDWAGFINGTIAMQPEVISAFEQSAASAAAATSATMSPTQQSAGAASQIGVQASGGAAQIVYVTGTVEIDGQSAGRVLFKPIRQAEAEYGTNLVGNN